jgi:hypothetical protein
MVWSASRSDAVCGKARAWRLDKAWLHSTPTLSSPPSFAFPHSILFHYPISLASHNPQSSLSCRIFAKNLPNFFDTYAFYPPPSTSLYHLYLLIVVIIRFRPPPTVRPTAISRASDTQFSRHPLSIYQYLSCNHVKLPLRRSPLCHCYAVSPSPFSQPPRSLTPRASCLFGTECPPSTAIQGPEKSQGASSDSCLQCIH